MKVINDNRLLLETESGRYCDLVKPVFPTKRAFMIQVNNLLSLTRSRHVQFSETQYQSLDWQAYAICVDRAKGYYSAAKECAKVVNAKLQANQGYLPDSDADLKLLWRYCDSFSALVERPHSPVAIILAEFEKVKLAIQEVKENPYRKVVCMGGVGSVPRAKNCI